ncbi:GNAT family N-acetyltransferase [Nesterenkonia massiliensis]|uniref:GNAT family N-acetyltransferase n=1 Tax=Nesterenkonia massiliensis TaxID=1232429 RepID=A0ABT2HND1_9MICC|nr:GNAT family N-acetyltransferase [Nesterenkonia massiliensis]
MRIIEDPLRHPAVLALIAEHLADMHATSPPESIHALEVDALRADNITLWTAWDNEGKDALLLGCAALKTLSPAELEIKTMRVTAAARGRGVGRRLLEHLLEQARARGARRLSLETGVEDYFAAARRLYQRAGFVECPPFGTYREDPNSVFMRREI